MNYSRLVIEQVFDTIWETWINKSGERAAQKAVEVLLKSDVKKEDLLKACETYRLENLGADPDFTYKLSNFIHNDHWKDSLEQNSLDGLKRKYDEAVHLIGCWNKACKPHWCPVTDIESKVAMATKALNDKPFKDKWQQALTKASKIFTYPFREGEPRAKIILSFRWFTTITHDKHTVLRIVEGEYGHPVKENVPKTPKTMEIDYNERKKALEEFNKLFPDIKQKPKKEPKPNVPSKEALELARRITESIGKIAPSESEGDDPFKFV